MELTHWSNGLMQALLQTAHTLANSALWTGETALAWVHDLSLAALSAAVITLGLVMLLELRALAQLRRSVDTQLGRVFERLDLLRVDYARLLEEQGPARGHSHAGSVSGAGAMNSISVAGLPTAAPGPKSAAAANDKIPKSATKVGERSPVRAGVAGAAMLLPSALTALPLAAGEARLMASLAEARARRAHPPLS